MEEIVDESKLLEHIQEEMKNGLANIEVHLVRPKLEFPVITEDGRKLEGLGVICPECSQQLIDLRGDLRTTFGTIEADLHGFCLNCYQEGHHLMRWHKEGHWTCCTNGEWFQVDMMPYEPGIRGLISKYFRRWFR